MGRQLTPAAPLPFWPGWMARTQPNPPLRAPPPPTTLSIHTPSAAPLARPGPPLRLFALLGLRSVYHPPPRRRLRNWLSLPSRPLRALLLLSRRGVRTRLRRRHSWP